MKLSRVFHLESTGQSSLDGLHLIWCLCDRNQIVNVDGYIDNYLLFQIKMH